MNRDQAIGAVILVGSIVGVIIYALLLYNYAIVVLQITAFVAVAGVLIIMAWIGWTMATTPPPAPLEPELAPVSASKGSSETPASEKSAE
jgi:predicted DNA-binding transcriptional regulator